MKIVWKIIKWTWFPILVLGVFLWFRSPVTFLKKVDPADIACITIFDGNTGSGSEITKAKDVAYIVENIQSVPVERTGISFLEPGYRFRMTFTDEQLNTYLKEGGAPYLDGQYTVFGEVTSGLDVVERIQNVERDSLNRPINDVRIFKA